MSRRAITAMLGKHSVDIVAVEKPPLEKEEAETEEEENQYYFSWLDSSNAHTLIIKSTDTQHQYQFANFPDSSEMMTQFLYFYQKSWKVLVWTDMQYRNNSTLNANFTVELEDQIFETDIEEYETITGHYNQLPIDQKLIEIGKMSKKKNHHDKTKRQFGLLFFLIEKNRKELFHCYSMVPLSDPPIYQCNTNLTGNPFSAKTNTTPLKLTFKSLTFEWGNYEPFFCSVFLFSHLGSQTKESETFDFDLNSDNIAKLYADLGENSHITRSKSILIDVPPDPGLYLIFTISKVIKGDGDEKDLKYYFTSNVKSGQIDKFCVEVSERTKIFGRYRQIFAIAAKPIYTNNEFLKGDISISGFTYVNNDTYWSTISSLVSGSHIFKKNKIILAKLQLSAQVMTTDPPGRLDSSYNPRKPIGNEDQEVIRELQYFSPQIPPFTSIISNLYFYPVSLNIRSSSRLSINSALTVVAEIKLLGDDSNPGAEGLPVIYGDSTGGSFVNSKLTLVSYPSTKPNFIDEIKIKIPFVLTPSIHILVSFYTVKCDIQKMKDVKEKTTLLGQSFIPIFSNNRLIGNLCEDLCNDVPLYQQELQPGYLSLPGQKKDSLDGKGMFSFKTRTISSLYPTDELLAILFNVVKTGDESQMNEIMDVLCQEPPKDLLPFMVPTMDLLFSVICNTPTGDVQKRAFIAICNVLEVVVECSHQEYLESYIHYHLETTKTNKQIYEVLPTVWNQNHTNPLAQKFCWFFYGVILKSLAINKGLKEKEDSEICSRSLYSDLRVLILGFSSTISQIASEDKELSMFITLHTAAFARDLLSIIPSGPLFYIIKDFLPLSETAPDHIVEEKWRFLSILCSSENYLLLNPPPFLYPTKISILDLQSSKPRFFTMLILHNLLVSLKKSGVRNYAIRVFRDLFWRSSRDQRVMDRKSQERIAEMYFPYIHIVLEFQSIIFSKDVTVSEQQDWLICFCGILGHLNSNFLLEWWKNEKLERKVIFLSVLSDEILRVFNYGGRLDENWQFIDCSVSLKNVHSLWNDLVSPKTDDSDIDTKKGFITSTSTFSPKKKSRTSSRPKSHKLIRSYISQLNLPMNDSMSHSTNHSILYEKNTRTEVALILIKILLELVSGYRKEFHHHPQLIEKLFKVLIQLLSSTAEHIITIVIYTVNLMISEFSSMVFKANNSCCEDIVYYVLRHCYSKIAKLRAEATTLLILMIENNIQETSSSSSIGHFNKIKLSMSSAIFKIFSGSLKSKHIPKLQDAFIAISQYAKKYMNSLNTDKIPFGTEITEYLQKLWSTIETYFTIQDCFDPFIKSELYYKMTLNYLESPSLIVKNLELLYGHHNQNQNDENAAFVQILMAAFIGSYLNKGENAYPSLEEWSTIFPSIIKELNVLTSTKDQVYQEGLFSEQEFIDCLSCAIIHFEKALLIELGISVNDILLSHYKKNKDFKNQMKMHDQGIRLCGCVSQIQCSFHHYVSFYSAKDKCLNEYIYRTSQFYRLREFLMDAYQKNVQFCGINVDISSMKDENTLYITFIPLTYQEKKFFYLAPKEKGLDDLKTWYIRTYIQSDSSFPTIFNRLPVTKKEQIDISPSEYFLDKVLSSLNQMKKEVNKQETDTKSLSNVLAGVLHQNNTTSLIEKFFAEHLIPASVLPQFEKAVIDLVIFTSLCLQKHKQNIQAELLPFQSSLEECFYLLKQVVCDKTNTPMDQIKDNFNVIEIPKPSKQDINKPKFSIKKT